jgi:hypothetical protein
MEAQLETKVSRRFVACADVLGFTELVRNTSLHTLAKAYEAMLQDAFEACRSQAMSTSDGPESVKQFDYEIGHAVFSDTILLWSEPIGVDGSFDVDGWHFLMSIAFVFTAALRTGFPLRVGIGFGECVIRPKQNVFLGNAILEAHDAERSQDWVGVGCHPSCLTADRAGSLTMRDRTGRWVGPLVSYPVPTKPGAPCRDLVWTIDWPFWEAPDDLSEDFLIAQVAKYDRTMHAAKWRNALDYYLARTKYHRNSARFFN